MRKLWMVGKWSIHPMSFQSFILASIFLPWHGWNIPPSWPMYSLIRKCCLWRLPAWEDKVCVSKTDTLGFKSSCKSWRIISHWLSRDTEELLRLFVPSCLTSRLCALSRWRAQSICVILASYKSNPTLLIYRYCDMIKGFIVLLGYSTKLSVHEFESESLPSTYHINMVRDGRYSIASYIVP